MLQTSVSIQKVTCCEKNYPKLLQTILDPPLSLYFQGNLDCLIHPVAVVGTRNMTEYGAYVTETFIQELVSAGCTIVSGLAFGIDSLAHATAIKCHGKTAAILPSGLDRISPVSHTQLALQIIKTGGVLLSEYSKEVRAKKYHFIARNRIIAGISLGVLVVEGAKKSGTQITAHWAAEYGRPVFAASGPINSPYSEGTKLLINTGAKLVTSAKDILEELNITPSNISKNQVVFDNKDQKVLYQTLIGFPEGLLIEQLSQKLHQNISDLHINLTLLEINGLIRRVGWKYFITM